MPHDTVQFYIELSGTSNPDGNVIARVESYWSPGPLESKDSSRNTVHLANREFPFN